MTTINTPGRISDRPSQTSSSSTPGRSIFPGFLATDDADFDYPSQASPSSSRSSIDSPIGLPYLRDSLNPSSSTSSLNKQSAQVRSSSSSSSPQAYNSHAGPSTQPHAPPLVVRKELRSPGPKRRPPPLVLGRARDAAGINEQIQLQRDDQEPQSAISDDRGSLTNELQDLSLLRKSVRQNLLARPVDSPLTGGSDSDRGSSGQPTPDMTRSSSAIPDSETITVSETLRLLRSSPQILVIDTRPLGSFLESHFPRSANISIPSLIFKRFRKSSGQHATSWDSLGGFVSTQAGREVWDGLEVSKPLDVVVVGITVGDDLAKVLVGIMKSLVTTGSVKLLRGGWGAVMASPDASDMLVTGELSNEGRPSLATSLPPSKSALTFNLPPPAIPPASPPRGVSHRPSMPSLRPDSVTAKRNLPSLSITGGGQGSSARRTPKLSLNLDKPLRSATLGSFQTDAPPTPGGGGFGAIRANNHLSVKTGSSVPRSPGFTLSIPKTPYHGSFQTLCHEQSKLPPSPSSFGDVKRVIGNDEDYMSPAARTPGTQRTSGSTARPQIEGTRTPGFYHSPDQIGTGEMMTTASRGGMAPFVVSTILPSFLYLGPEIASEEEVETLRRMGVKRILNVALECDDDSGLGLKEKFKYYRIPMRDIVEESGVAQGMRESCDFLDDARLHSAPTYVHCKAGKSRSVTVVLAYLIHANAWTLKTSYAYVAERRKGISPNIGFVAELMQFEESELGLKQSGGVHGEGSSGGGKDADEEEHGGPAKPNPRHMRESLPPAWSSSVDSYKRPPKVSPLGSGEDGEKGKGDEEGRHQVGDEREVRKNGQWVHQRRAPVDRTTLQPGRRVSKAGLESLRPLNSTSSTSPRPSPTPSPAGKRGDRHHAATPGTEGALRWV
ncbi:hypothetical protein CI109_100477 [Kwoniella shandongensis]|uniref:protein-tyrosine-phosphatase n=1 Tax=Kwoniella shandongensis TaxID=1734106 RepID=A0A5M6C4L6_9TREE|nr:uncharacterized protein CI109_001680 [Kwoniella shandongensis]KAA5529741.1 hypothetical protein CI109_001680 [Kwoniella shandongensis]